jgi:hypothetical protein
MDLRALAAWRDKWNSVMAGGNYPMVELPFSAGFAAAVDAEIASAI